MLAAGVVAALCVPIASATAAPSVRGPGEASTAGRWTEPATIAKGEITEVLAPPGYGRIYDETRFVWRQGSTLSSRLLRTKKVDVAGGVTAAAASRTALAWHQSQGSGEGVHLRVYRTIGSSGGDPGWTESRPMLLPETYDPAATPLLAVADDISALTSAVVYSRTTPTGVQLEATAYSTGGSSTTQVTLGASQVLATPGGHLDELAAEHGAKFIAVAYRRTATDGATSVVLRTSPVTHTVNELTWGPEQVVCQAPAGAAAACSQPTFGRNEKKQVHLFLRGPEGLQYRTVSASGAAEPVALGPATGPFAVMDASWAGDPGRGKSYDVDLSVAATRGNRTTVWRLPAAGPVVGTSVRTPGVRLLALGQHGTGRMLAWSDGTGVTTWTTNGVRQSPESSQTSHA